MNAPLVLSAGQVIAGRITIIGPLLDGSGYQGFHTVLGGPVLLHWLGSCDPAEEERFLATARAVAQVQQVNVARLCDFGVEAELGGCYFATEALEGTTLAEQAGMLEADEAARLMLDLLAALDAVHAAGLRYGELSSADVVL